MKQMSFGFIRDYKKEFGGSLLAGKRKTRRPLSTKSPIHLILKADQKGIFSPSNRSLDKLIRKTAQQFDIHLYDLAVNWSIFIFDSHSVSTRLCRIYSSAHFFDHSRCQEIQTSVLQDFRPSPLHSYFAMGSRSQRCLQLPETQSDGILWVDPAKCKELEFEKNHQATFDVLTRSYHIDAKSRLKKDGGNNPIS